MGNLVKVFSNEQSGAPALSGTVGTLVGVLDACLVTGYGSKTLDALVVSGGVATATVNAGHAFGNFTTGFGPVILIEGANQTGLNGEHRITVLTSTTFSFVPTGVADGTASGTITAKRAPAGCTIAAQDTNKRAYKLKAGSTGFHLWVDDTGVDQALYARVAGWEEVTDLASMAGPFPNVGVSGSGTYKWTKSATNDGTARAWILISDGKTILFFVKNNASYRSSPYIFGDLKSYKADDAYACMISMNWGGGNASYWVGGCYNSVLCPWERTNGPAFARKSDDVLGWSRGWPVAPLPYPDANYSRPVGNAASLLTDHDLLLPYPNPANDSLIVRGPLEYHDGLGLRGYVRGLYYPLHASPLAHGATIADIQGLDGKVLYAVEISSHYSTPQSNGQILVDITEWE